MTVTGQKLAFIWVSPEFRPPSHLQLFLSFSKNTSKYTPRPNKRTVSYWQYYIPWLCAKFRVPRPNSLGCALICQSPISQSGFNIFTFLWPFSIFVYVGVLQLSHHRSFIKINSVVSTFRYGRWFKFNIHSLIIISCCNFWGYEE